MASIQLHYPPSPVCFEGTCMVSNIGAILAVIHNSRRVVNLSIDITGCSFLLHCLNASVTTWNNAPRLLPLW